MTDIRTSDVPGTEAGRAMLAGAWALGPGQTPMANQIRAIEAEAREQALAAAEEAVAGLPRRRSAWTGHEESPLIHRKDLLSALASLRKSVQPTAGEPRWKRTDWSNVVVDEGDEAP